MSVIRYNLESCIGCKKCYDICPMDVFRMNEETKKSVIVYPENCISCGQCFLCCPGHSLAIANEQYGYGITTTRPNSKLKMAPKIYTADGAQYRA